MRILYVGPLPPTRGGIAQHGAQLVAALRRLGHDVEVEAWRAQYPAVLYPGPRAAGSARVPGRRLTWWNPASWWAAGRRGRRADVVVMPWVTPAQAPALTTVSRAARPSPTVLIVHNPVPHERRALDVGLTRWLLRRAAGAVVHATSAAEQLAELAPGLPTRVVAHPPNIEVAWTPLPTAPPHRLLFLGYVRPYKGLADALEAMALLRRTSAAVELTVAGEFWEPVIRTRQRVRALGLDDAVDLVPRYVDADAVARLLASHHVLVAPYRSATQSGVVPLALAAGRPVVATRVGGLAEAVVDGRDGVLSEPGDPQSLAAAISRALADLPSLAASLRAPPAWEDVAAAVIDLANGARRHRGAAR